jgi:hypothetical protein
MTAKELRYALNSRLAGRRGPGTIVSEKTLKRWAQRWVVAGLVEESVVRQTGPKGGRPLLGFKVKSLYERDGVSKTPPSFFGTPSAGSDLSFGQGSDEIVQNPEVSETSENETVQQGTVSPETHETELPVETFGEKSPESAHKVLDSFGHEEGLSKTSAAESLSSTGIFENQPEVLDAASGIYREPGSTQDYGAWEEDW